MKERFKRIFGLATTSTAKDTYVLFTGNLASAFWGFLFTLFVARALSIADFGVFSAALNLVNILASLADIGISSGSVNFVSEHIAKGNESKANEYIKASFIIRILIVLGISLVIVIFAPMVSTGLLATRDPKVAVWAAIIPIFLFPDVFFPPILQAKNKFLHSTIVDNVFYIGRLIFALALYIYGALTISMAFLAFAVGFLLDIILIYYFLRTDFWHARPSRNEYSNLLKFSGWIGVNRIISSISGKLDVQMLAAMVGAVATGIYSIPARLASFIVVLAGSYSAVLATRLAGFGDKEKEKSYIIKSTLAILPISAGIVLWIIVAKPFMFILFGQKYLASAPIFQALAAAQIPFLFTVPAVSAIIYSMKKPVYIGTLAFVQIAAIFLLNFILIPRFGPFGPTITFGITNTLLAIYVWFLVIRYYWR